MVEMLWKVELEADGIQVESDNEDQATRNAREDAAEFYGDWNYEAQGAEILVSEDVEEDEYRPTADVDEMNISVELCDDEDGLYTFTGYFTVVVEAPDEETAMALGEKAPATIRYGKTADLAA